MASPSGCRCCRVMIRPHLRTPCPWWFSWLSRYTRVRSIRAQLSFPRRSLIFLIYHRHRASCSSNIPCVHHLSDVDFSLAGGVQKASVAIQRLNASRSYHLLRGLLIVRIEPSRWCWHCLARIGEFLVKALRLVHLIRVIPGRKFSLRGNSAATSLP